jgi:hypothetical protein
MGILNANTRESDVQRQNEVYPEDLVALVDRHALSPVYSFLTEEDQSQLIQRIHAEKRTSVVAIDGVKSELAQNREINWYAVRRSNFGMLHSYHTVIQTHKSPWVPFSGHDEEI